MTGIIGLGTIQSLSGCWVSSRISWASVPSLLDPSSLTSGQSWPGPLLLNPHSHGIDWMNLGRGSGFRVLHRSFVLSFHQEMVLLYPLLPQICPSRTTPSPRKHLNQDSPGSPQVKIPHFSLQGWLHPGQGTKTPGWENGKDRFFDCLSVTLKITRHLELGGFFSPSNPRYYKNYCLAFSLAWEKTESVSEWYITDWMD